MLMVSIKGASTIFGLLSKLIGKPFARCYAQPTYWQSLEAKEKVAL